MYDFMEESQFSSSPEFGRMERPEKGHERPPKREGRPFSRMVAPFAVLTPASLFEKEMAAPAEARAKDVP